MAKKDDQFKVSELDKQDDPIEAQTDKWVTDLVFNDYIEDNVDVAGKLKVRFRTLTTQQTVDIKQRISDKISENRDATKDLIDTLNVIYQLAHSVQDINGKPIGTNFEEKMANLESKPAIFIESIWFKYQELMNKVTKILNGVDVVKKS